MKLKSSLFIVATMAGLAASASALTIDIVGSTAGRGAVYTSVLASLVGGAQTSSACSGSTLSGSNQAIIFGNYDADGAGPGAAVSVIIRVNFSGSAQGVNLVANQSPESFYKTTVGTSGNTTGVAFSGGNIETSAPEFGYSDVFQGTTQFSTPALANEQGVAVIPFQFFKTQDGNVKLTGVTSQLVKNIYGGLGSAPLSLFTGDSADTSMVYCTGRDNLSGTRITTFAETGTSQSAVVHYKPSTTATDGTGSATLGSLFTGAAGFSKGSDVINVLNSTFSGGTIIGYVGASDWPTASVNNAQPLKFNGVAYSDAAVYEGSYSFWGYLHQFRQALTGTTLAFYDSVASGINGAPGAGLLNVNDMHVARDGDGSAIYPYTP